MGQIGVLQLEWRENDKKVMTAYVTSGSGKLSEKGARDLAERAKEKNPAHPRWILASDASRYGIREVSKEELQKELSEAGEEVKKSRDAYQKLLTENNSKAEAVEKKIAAAIDAKGKGVPAKVKADNKKALDKAKSAIEKANEDDKRKATEALKKLITDQDAASKEYLNKLDKDVADAQDEKTKLLDSAGPIAEAKQKLDNAIIAFSDAEIALKGL